MQKFAPSRSTRYCNTRWRIRKLNWCCSMRVAIIPLLGRLSAPPRELRNIVIGAGLAEMRPGEGTLVAFATGPGQVALDGEGRHSPFTRALLAHVATPGLEIRHALTRVRAQVADDTRKQQLRKTPT